jgi:PIN domain nuclease of toxin-antitoxin system
MLTQPERFSEHSRRLLETTENDLYLSAVSSWEIAIKHGLGKLRLPARPAELIPELMLKTVVTVLPIQHIHALRVADLPSHHRDPFDRLLVAQAQVEDLLFLTADPQVEPYEIEILLA